MTSRADATERRAESGLDLPPGFTGIALREVGDAMAHARRIADEAGAGTLVWVRRLDSIELAVVLEPEAPLSAARRVLYAVMSAMGDALAAHVPPEKPIEFLWPDTILLDGGIVGGARLAWPEGAKEGVEPAWLVAGVTLRVVVPHVSGAGRIKGTHALDLPLVKGTGLQIEGFEILEAASLIESFARHLLVQIDQWQEKGFAAVGQQFLARLPEVKGMRRGIDGNGDLLIRSLKAPKEVEGRALLTALLQPQWLDPATGEPWL